MFIEVITILILALLLNANYYLILNHFCYNYLVLSVNVKLIDSVVIALTQNHKLYFYTQYHVKIQ